VIIFRYVGRDVLTTTVAVTLVLMLITMSNRFVNYLSEAAAGELDAGILFPLIAYHIPGFLVLVLPLAFFLAILLSYGRMYVDNEITVLYACGLSPNKLTYYTVLIAFVVAGIVAWLSLSATPVGRANSEALFRAQKNRGLLNTLGSGEFYSLRGGRGVIYSEDVSNAGTMHDVFLALPDNGKRKKPAHVVVLAESGHSQTTRDDEERYLVLENGYRIAGMPGHADFLITSFDEYGQRLSRPTSGKDRDAKATMLPTKKLWSSQKPAHRAELLWRLSIPLLVLVMTFIAVPLSRTNPRQGRFVKIFPAVILYILYLVILNIARHSIEQELPLALLGFWSVHLLFFGIAALLTCWNGSWRPTIFKTLYV
jgi:lipopolysaccharide export system permease protein